MQEALVQIGLQSDPEFGVGFLTGLVKKLEPFTYLRIGDGELGWMFGTLLTPTGQGEDRSPEVVAALNWAIPYLLREPTTVLGDFRTCKEFTDYGADGDFTKYDHLLQTFQPEEAMRGDGIRKVSIESLNLFDRRPSVVHFYQAIKDDPRPKFLVGPPSHKNAALMLDAAWVEVPPRAASLAAGRVVEALGRQIASVTSPLDPMLLFCAGCGTKIMMAAIHSQMLGYGFTMIDLGSSLDPLFVGRTRRPQIESLEAADLFAEVSEGQLVTAVQVMGNGLQRPQPGAPQSWVKTQATRNLAEFAAAAEVWDLDWCLMDGTLLGAIRDGDFCAGDEDDIDIGIADEDFDRLLLVTSLLETRGLHLGDRFYHRGRIEGVKLHRGASHFDLIRINHHPTRAECYNLGRRPTDQGLKVLAFVYPDHHHARSVEMLFKGIPVLIPDAAEQLLTTRYGDWRTPIPRDQFDWFNQSNRDSIREEYDAI